MERVASEGIVSTDALHARVLAHIAAERAFVGIDDVVSNSRRDALGPVAIGELITSVLAAVPRCVLADVPVEQIPQLPSVVEIEPRVAAQGFDIDERCIGPLIVGRDVQSRVALDSADQPQLVAHDLPPKVAGE